MSESATNPQQAARLSSLPETLTEAASLPPLQTGVLCFILATIVVGIGIATSHHEITIMGAATAVHVVREIVKQKSRPKGG